MELQDNRGRAAATVVVTLGTLTHLAIMFVAGIAAFSLGGMDTWRMFQDGGPFMYVIAVLALAGGLAELGLGLWFVRRQHAWAWLPIVVPLFVLLTAIAGVFLALLKLDAALDGATLERAPKTMLYAQGIAESLAISWFGAASAMILAASGSTILAARALTRVGKKPFGKQSGTALALGLAGLAAVMIARFFCPDLSATLPFGAFPALVGIVGVALASAALTGPREGMDDTAGALGDALVAGLLAIAGVAFAAVIVRSNTLITGFSTLSAASPVDRVALLGALWTNANKASYAHFAFAAPVALALLAPLGFRLVYLGRAWRRVGGGLVGVALAAAIAFGVPYMQANRLSTALAKMADVPKPNEVINEKPATLETPPALPSSPPPALPSALEPPPEVPAGPQIEGRLAPNAVKRVVNQNLSKVRACYELGLKKNPALEGKVVVEFVIGKTGAVTSATAKESTVADAKVGQCVAQMFRAMAFPKPEDGTVSVTYPLEFKPGA